MSSTFDRMFMPSAIAVVGASRNPMKWGSRLILNSRDAGFAGTIYGVNPSAGAEIAGASAVSSLRNAEEPVELAFLAIPSAGVLAALEDCIAMRVPNVVVPGSGFGEFSEEGAVLEREILELARENGVRLLGPNCFGVASSVGKHNLTPFAEMPAGRIGLISQSGNVAAHAFIGARKRGIGFSHSIGLGNQLDISFGEILSWIARDESTDAVAMYVEGLPAGVGPSFLEGLAACRAAGKPVVAIKAGASDAGAAVAGTHTRSLSSNDRVWEDVFAATGVHRASSVDEMMDLLSLVVGARPQGRRVGLVTDGGGDSILALDELSLHSLAVPGYSSGTRADLDVLMPAGAPRSEGRNPLTLDTAGGVEDDPRVLARCVERVASSGEVDAIVIAGLFGTYMANRNEENLAAQDLIEIARAHGVPMVVHCPLSPTESEPIRILQDAGIPVFTELHAMICALSAFVDVLGLEPTPNVSLVPLSGEAATVVMLPPQASHGLLSASGIDLPAQSVSRSLDDLQRAAARIGYPICLKIADVSVVHKSDVGGVRLGIADPEQLAAAAAEMWLALPGSDLLVMPNLRSGFEIMLGVRSDPQFGAVLVVGRGGVWAEIEADTAVLVGSFDRERFRSAIDGLRCAPILNGARGQSPLDVSALAGIAERLVGLVEARPELSIDLNPVLLYPSGAGVADIRVVVSE